MLNFNLDLQKQDNFSKAFTARMGDVGEQFSVTLFDNQTPYVPVDGDVVSFRVVTPSGKFASVAGTMSGNKATFTLNGQITSEAGYYQRAYVAVSNGTKLRTTQDLIFFSLGNSDINKGRADYYVAELDKLLQQLNEEFDEWLAEREQDYSDLLARIVALTNRMTGLETKLDEIIAQLQKNMINTTNILDTSLLLAPESNVRRRVDGQTFDVRVWGGAVFNNAATIQMFEPNKTYHAKYVAELLTVTGGSTTLSGHFGMCIYSGKTGFPTVWIVDGIAANIATIKVGDKVTLEKTFTTPAELYNPAAGYQILAYGRRDDSGTIDMARFHDIMIQEGSMFTGLETNPDNTLTKFDENRLKKSILVDPKMTGLNQPTIEGGTGTPTTEVTFSTAGLMQIKNLLDTGRARVYWTATQLGMDQVDALGAFEIRVKMRQVNSTAATIVELGYMGGQDNATINVDASNAWKVYTAVIQPNTNSAFCIYIEKGITIQIQELYIYPASTDVTSKRVERIETTLTTVEKSTTGNPEILNNIDLNTVVHGGNYVVYQPTNAPRAMPGAYGYLSVYGFNSSDNNNLQVLTMRSGLKRRYFRQQVNSTWQEWRWIPDIFADGRVDTIADDFNNQKETGQCVITTTSNSPTGTASTSWYLEVIRYGSSGNYILQKATQLSSTRPYTYQRQLFNGTWTAWQKVTTDTDYLPVEDAGAAKDLNNFGTTSEFMIYNPINAPVATQTWYVEVKGYNSTYCKQTITSTGTADNTYTRQKVNKVWTPWRLIPKTTV